MACCPVLISSRALVLSRVSHLAQGGEAEGQPGSWAVLPSHLLADPWPAGCWFFLFFSCICIVFLPCSLSAPCWARGEHPSAGEGANSQRCSPKLPGGPAPLPKSLFFQRAACSWGLNPSPEAPGPVKRSCRPLRRHPAAHLRQLRSRGSAFHCSYFTRFLCKQAGAESRSLPSARRALSPALKPGGAEPSPAGAVPAPCAPLGSGASS